MTNRNEEPGKDSLITSPQSRKQGLKPSNTEATRNKSYTVIAAVIIALGALATSLYTLSLKQELQHQLFEQSSQLDKLAQKQEQVDTQILEKTDTVAEVRSLLYTKFDALNKQLQTALSQRLYQNQNWQLLKARYYIELAQINAHWSKSFSSTITMLQQADVLLQQLNDPKILDIRQAIAKDITQLNAIPKIDIAGILSQLDAAQNSLNDLQILSIPSDGNQKVTEHVEASNSSLSVWRLRFQDSLNLLSKLVIIRRNDENIKPLISPAFEAVLKENIRLNLQEAQWAVLNGNQQVYQLVLNQAITSIKNNFTEGTQSVTALLQKLSELKQIQLIPKKPEINSGLSLLNQLINDKESTVKQPGLDGQGGNSP